MKVELANGLHYPVDNFDVIFVLQGVQGQNVLLPSIATTIKNDARIVFRSLVDGYEKNLKEYVDLSKYFIVADTVKSEILLEALKLKSKILKQIANLEKSFIAMNIYNTHIVQLKNEIKELRKSLK